MVSLPGPTLGEAAATGTVRSVQQGGGGGGGGRAGEERLDAKVTRHVRSEVTLMPLIIC